VKLDRRTPTAASAWEPCPECPYSLGLVEGPGGSWVACSRCEGEGRLPVLDPSLLSPANQRPVAYDCPCCGGSHTTDVPWMWEGPRHMWLVCHATGQTVRVVVDCSPA
jgi:hypothetical protein